MTTNRNSRPGTVGRPKRYRQHSDRGYFASRPSVVNDVVAWLQDGAPPAVQAKFSDQPSLMSERSWLKVSPITVNDPRCCWMVVDALLKSEPGTYIRAADLAIVLSTANPQWYWDKSILGRILSGIREACRQVYEVIGGYVEDSGDIPFAQGRDTRGYYYVVDPLGGNEGRLWLLLLRANLWRDSLAQQGSDQQGEFAAFLHRGDVGFSAAWLSDEVAPDAVRSKEAFHGQATGRFSLDDVVPGRERAIPEVDVRGILRGDGPAAGFAPAGGSRSIG